MCNFTYESHGTNTYLVYEIRPEDTVDSLSLGMLTNNKISGLAGTIFTQMDSVKYIKYNISSKVSAKQFFSGVVNKKRLLGVFLGIARGIISSEEYMIDQKTLLLDMEHIFVDVTTCESVLICLPISNVKEEETDAATFFKNIMFTTQFDQTENCDHVAKIMNFLNSMPIFSITEFKKMLDSLEEEEKKVTVNVVKSAVVAPPQQRVQPSVQPVAVSTPAVTPAPSVAPQPTQPHQPVAVAPVQPSGFEVPAGPTSNKKVSKKSQTKTAASSKGEDKMSMFTLLTHYSKENAAIYKEQKAAEKEQKNGNKEAKGKDNKKTKAAEPKKSAKKGKPSATKPPQTQFAIPGQPVEPITSQTTQQAQPPVQPVQQVVQQARPQPVQQVKQPVQQQASQHVQQMSQQPQQAAPQVAQQPVQQVQQPVQQYKPVSPSVNFGETTILGGGPIGETTVLNAGMQQSNAPIPHLIRQKNNEKIMIDKPVYRIGKERSYVDYFIGDNTAISRSHANIISHEGQYFVEDTNSTNHTFVDGVMIQSSVQTPISHGSKIRLANEDFEFRLY